MDERENYFQILLNDNTNPCLVIDTETLDAVFINNKMQHMLKESKYLNSETRKCYELLHNRNNPCNNCNINEIQKDVFSELNFYNKNLNRSYRVSNTSIEYKNRTYILNKFFISSSFINNETNFNQAILKSEKIFKENNPDDFENLTNDFLKLLGEFHQAEKTYVYYLDDDKFKFQWVDTEKNYTEDDFINKMGSDELSNWLDTHDENGIIDVNSSDDTELSKLFNVNSVTVCVMKDIDFKTIGFVGFNNRTDKKLDYRLLTNVTKFICDRFTSNHKQDELKKMSDVDFLTGFLNKNKYKEQIKSLELNQPKNLGVAFANINGLRKINNYNGTDSGDNLIRLCAKILEIFFEYPIYRISGDEFVIFCIGETEDDFIDKVATLRDFLKQNLECPLSIGHSWKSHNYNLQQMIVESDIVMYINKQSYYHSLNKNIDDIDNDTLKDLLSYIANEEFIVYVQPQVELSTNEVIAGEALIRRFDKNNNKMVFPDQFIPLYEEKSLIRHIDLFVVTKICKYLYKWLQYGKEIPIAVNLSRVTLTEYDIVDIICNICDENSVPHHLLIIEVTERVGLIKNDVASNLIDSFKNRGFKVSLDDFGCAYSNIVTLANVSVDEIKIDKSLVDYIEENQKNKAIVKSVIDMCDSIGNNHTLAEGIETQQQADILRGLNCKYGQGYLYSRPIPIDEFEERYIKNK